MKKLIVILVAVAIALFIVGCGTKTIVVPASPVPAVTVTAAPSVAPSVATSPTPDVTYNNGPTVDSQVSTAAAMYHAAYVLEVRCYNDYSHGSNAAGAAQGHLAVAAWNAAHDYYNAFPTTDNDRQQETYLDAFARDIRAAIVTTSMSYTARDLSQAATAWSVYTNYVDSISQT